VELSCKRGVSLNNSIYRANMSASLAEDALCRIDVIPMTDIIHHIDIHWADLIAGAALDAFFAGRSFPYYSNRCRHFHDKRDRTKNFAEGPLFLEEVGKNDGTGKVEGVAYQKPTKLPPFPQGLVDMEGPIIISGIEEHQRYQ
jgi:hypothetical protein